MSLVIEVKSGSGTPPGVYQVVFVRAEAFNEGDFGPGVKLIWKILDGELAGEETNRICSLKLSPKTNLFKFVKALGGREPQPGEQIELDSFADTRGSVVVEELPSGSTRVSAFIRDQ
jgi:hypothetical protein